MIMVLSGIAMVSFRSPLVVIQTESTTFGGEGMKQSVGAIDDVGEPVGLSEGDPIGELVGPSLGRGVGLLEGEPVGAELGIELFVGLSDGAVLG
jgi:hypothetical protein